MRSSADDAPPARPYGPPQQLSGAFVAFSIFSATIHRLVAYGVLAFGRSGVAGRSRAATAGVPLAIAGTLLLLVGELS